MDLRDPGAVQLVWILFLGAIALTGLFLVLGWRAYVKQRLTVVPTIAITFVSVSYLWFLGIVAIPSVFGPDYSDLRFTTIDFNVWVVVIAGVLALFRVRDGWRVCLPVFPLLMLWLYLSVVSVAV